MQCEFCGETSVTARYLFVVPRGIRKDTSACVVCEALIDAGDWESVVQRTVDTYYVKHPHDPRPRSEVTALVTETWRVVRDTLGLRKERKC
jgi:hypothetical protein